MKISKNLMNVNHTAKSRGKRDIQWIVIHYVGALGDAKANTDYYKSGYVGASADFWVGFAGDVWQGNDFWNYYSWHCGGGLQGPNGHQFYGTCRNGNSVGIEMCVHKRSTRTMLATDRDWYFEPATVRAAAELVVYLMDLLDITIDHVIRHYDVTGKICPAPYVHDEEAWRKFKRLILDIKAGKSPQAEAPKWYRVAASFTDGKYNGQLGAYESKENAIEACPAGYSVFSPDEKKVHTAEKAGTVASDFDGMSEAAAAAKILELARAEGNRAGILPSLIAAQAILESGYCRTTELVKKSNNCFGMKAGLSGNSWPTVWDGKSKVTVKTTEEYSAGTITTIDADFRAYPSIEKSFEDHSCYLLGAMNGTKKRYAGLTACRSYEEAAMLVKAGGYATDSRYVPKLCSIIERYGLDKYDAEVAKPVPAEKKFAPDGWYRVGKAWKDGACVGQVGAFHDPENAKAAAMGKDGLFVFDPSGSVVYPKSVTVAERAKSKPATEKPSRLFVGRVTVERTAVRTKAGSKNPQLEAWPELAKGNLVDVLASANKWWYKVKIADKHVGYVAKKDVAEA